MKKFVILKRNVILISAQSRCVSEDQYAGPKLKFSSESKSRENFFVVYKSTKISRKLFKKRFKIYWPSVWW